jgi:hypothetical protein
MLPPLMIQFGEETSGILGKISECQKTLSKPKNLGGENGWWFA